MKPKIIFSIVNYNTKNALDNCLGSIKKTQKEHGIFVFDNASVDGSKEMVEKKYPEAKLIKKEKNVGFGAGHNAVLKEAEYDYAVITNSDIIFLDGIEKTVKIFSDNPKIGACSIKLLNPDRTVQKNVYPIPTLKTEIAARIPFIKNPYSGYRFDYEKKGKVGCFNGACFVVNKKALDEVGLFGDEFFAYGEETDLFLRMQRKAWEVYYCPETKAIHLGGQTTKELEKRHLMYFESLLKFFRKNYGRGNESCLRAIATASSAIDFAKNVLLSFADGSRLKDARFDIEIIKICLRGIA